MRAWVCCPPADSRLGRVISVVANQVFEEELVLSLDDDEELQPSITSEYLSLSLFIYFSLFLLLDVSR